MVIHAIVQKEYSKIIYADTDEAIVKEMWDILKKNDPHKAFDIKLQSIDTNDYNKILEEHLARRKRYNDLYVDDGEDFIDYW